LQIMIYISLILALLSLGVGIVISILRITQGDEFFGGQATTITLLLLMSSFQLFFLFIIGQYVARTYDETRDRPLYVVASTVGLEPPQVSSQRIDSRHYIVATTHGLPVDSQQKESNNE